MNNEENIDTTIDATVVGEEAPTKKEIFKTWWNSPSKKKDTILQTALILGSIALTCTTGISI